MYTQKKTAYINLISWCTLTVPFSVNKVNEILILMLFISNLLNTIVISINSYYRNMDQDKGNEQYTPDHTLYIV